MSALIKSGKSLGKAFTLNFLLFLERIPPSFLTPGAFPSYLTGIVIVTSFPSKS